MSNKNDKSKVVIVGAGAMGLTLGHHLHLCGAEVTFLVRPSRATDLSRPQVLYSYDDASLKTFAEFKVTTEADTATALKPDYIIVTLDGTATTSAEGTTLLKTLGNAVIAGETVIIGSGVGMGLREHYLAATGLPANRVIMGTLGCFAYQVARANLPVHPPTDAALLSRADVAYRYYNKRGFLLENYFHAVSKRFARLYDASGGERCAVLEPHVYSIATTAPFAILAGSELLGWIPVSDLAKHKEVWRITTSAVREISRLKRNGWRGKLAGLLLTDWMIAWMWTSIEKSSLPLDFQAFNAFHHSAKVAAQDDDVRQACVIAGEREGEPMTALKELIERLGVIRRTKQA